MAYMSTNTGGGTPTKAEDADGNTKVQVEESADENKIRFDTAGSERMIIDETGKVGIGTSSPASAVEVQGGLTTTGSVLTLSTKETTVVANDVLGRINFQAPLEASGTDAILPGASIHALATDTFAAGNNETAIVLSTASSDAEHGSATSGAVFERMRITSAGNVGIGTSSPNADLHVKTTGASNNLVLGTNEVTGVKGLLIESTQSHDQNSGPVIGFYRNGTNTATAGGSQLGNVLFIGEDSANNATIYGQWKTWVIEAANTPSSIEAYGMAIQGLVGGANKSFINCLGAVDGSSSTDYGGLLGAEVVINQNSADMDFRVESVSEVSMLHVDAGNNRVGIGNNSPSSHLDVRGTTGGVLTLSTTETTVVANDVLGRINFQAPLEGSANETDYDAILPGASIHALATDTFATDNNETAIVLSTASSDAEGTAGGGLNERMRITSAGNVGIGTTSPNATLDVQGSVRFRASVEVCTSDPAPANAETGTIYQFTKGSAGVFTLPASPPVGTQFVLVNGTANDIVITRPHASVKINGATADKTNTTAYAATSIVAVVSNGNNSEWLVFGGI